MKQLKTHLILLLFFFCSSISGLMAQQQNFLTASGNKLYDVTGKEVRLTGVNWFGFETALYSPHGLWARDMKSVLQQIKDLGFNTIRVPWCNEMLDPGATISINSFGTDAYTGISPMNEEESTVSKPIELLDIFVKWCQENDMKIVLDNHSRAADGFLNEAFWYTPEYSEQRWINDWIFMAERYKDYSAVVAMDLNNEPHGSTWGNSNPATDWNKAAERCANAVLAANPNVLIMVEGVGEFEGDSYWWGGQLKGAEKYPVQISKPEKLVYSAHEYGPEVAQQDWFEASNFPQNMPGEWEEHFHYLYQNNTSPLFVGEFGIKNQDAFNGVAFTWFTNFMDFMGDIYSWTFWTMNPNSGDTGGILQDDWSSINQWKLNVLKPHFAPLIPNVVGGNPNPPVVVDGGTITGGPFTFTVGDGIEDNVSGISVSGSSGSNATWVVTDDQLEILGLPPTIAALEGVNFDVAGTGTCLIWYLRYEDGLQGAAVGNNAADLVGNFDLSNSITVTRNPVGNPPVVVDGGVITGGPFTFTVGDGIEDNVSGISVSGSSGSNATWVVTDDQLEILGLPPTIAALEGVNFDVAGVGTCLIWYLRYEDGLQGAAVGNNAANLSGNFDLSNSITVEREAPTTGPGPGPGNGGDCTFSTPIAEPLATINNSYSNIYVLGNGGPDLSNVINFTINWDLANNGLYQFSMNTNNGIPSWWNDFLPKVTQNFNSAQPSVTITGSGFPNLDGGYYATIDGDNFVLVSQTSEFTLYFSTSSTAPDCNTGNPNPPVVVDGGTITGGPFTFTVGDGIEDNVSGISVSGSSGSNATWVVTDDQLEILGLPPTIAALEGVNFDVAGTGTCLIWYLRYEDGLQGAAVGNNAADLVGNFDLSNSITVTRNPVGNPPVVVDGGVITGGPFTFTVGDGIEDNVSGISVSGSSGSNATWVVTDDQLEILGLPPTIAALEGVNFDVAGTGTCLIWYLRYEDGLQGAAVGNNAANLTGNFDLSNSITVEREAATGPGGPGGGSSDNAYIDRFIELRNEFYDPANGYFSADGSPHHSIESLIVEAPDHGHESTSELYSYWLWLEVMNGRITKDWQPLANVWNKVEEFIIPTTADQPTNGAYNPSSPAAYASEFPLPSNYPAPLDFGAPVGVDPVSSDLKAAYGDDIYQMHWLLDNDNFYGYGNRGDGVSTPSYINTFQRGEQESVYETVPHPSWESFDWGGTDGFLPLFIEDQNYAKQWRYTSAPDADARAVQAMYWAQLYAKEQGANLASLDLDKATKMGDFLRISMFDKYFKPLGVQSASSGAGTGYDSAHYLMSWYMSWGGSADPSSQWAFRIGSSHCHFGYQNPIAAYAMSQTPEFEPKSQNGKRDWTESLKRQMEFYTWLQSKEGAIAGGATNSWNGDYSVYPAGTPTFYDMAYTSNPVYKDPGSGTWFGWQAWSMERVAEYYYLTNDSMAKDLMDKWADWVKGEVRLIGDDDFDIPATLEWSGQPDTWNPNNPGSNNNLSVTVTDYGKDLGVAASMAKALIYYAAATEKYETLDTASRDLAKEVLDRMWNTYRDDKGVSSPESRGDFARVFEEEVYIPNGFTGVMANGDEIKPGVSFLDIRSGLKNDPDFPRLEEAYNAGEEYTQNYHRSWAQIEVALANAEYGFFFGDDALKAPDTKPVALNVVVSPNPANSFVNISTNFDMNNTRVRIIDISGREIYNQYLNASQRSARISIDGLPKGLYIVELSDLESGFKYNTKTIKE